MPMSFCGNFREKNGRDDGKKYARFELYEKSSGEQGRSSNVREMGV